jgi:hypothetical protein
MSRNRVGGILARIVGASGRHFGGIFGRRVDMKRNRVGGILVESWEQQSALWWDIRSAGWYEPESGGWDTESRSWEQESAFWWDARSAGWD